MFESAWNKVSFYRRKCWFLWDRMVKIAHLFRTRVTTDVWLAGSRRDEKLRKSTCTRLASSVLSKQQRMTFCSAEKFWFAAGNSNVVMGSMCVFDHAHDMICHIRLAQQSATRRITFIYIQITIIMCVLYIMMKTLMREMHRLYSFSFLYFLLHQCQLAYINVIAICCECLFSSPPHHFYFIL